MEDCFVALDAKARLAIFGVTVVDLLGSASLKQRQHIDLDDMMPDASNALMHPGCQRQDDVEARPMEMLAARCRRISDRTLKLAPCDL